MMKISFRPFLLVLVGSLFLFLLFSGFTYFSFAACPAGESCPDPEYCFSACDAYYDDQYCFCTVCPTGDYGGTCSTGGCGTCGGGVSCFLPGTKIATPGGEKEIEKIKPGDKIESFDPETQEMTLDTISESYFVTRDHYYVVKTESGREVKTTDEHPFYTGKESPPAKSLKDKLINFYSMVIIYFKDGLQTVKKSFFQ